MKRNLERAHRYSRLICGDILGCTRVIISHLKPWLLHIKNIITGLSSYCWVFFPASNYSTSLLSDQYLYIYIT